MTTAPHSRLIIDHDRGGETARGPGGVVTGGSRGIGKGVALGLGEAGAAVYVTGRTLQEGTSIWPGSLAETTAEVTRLGGKGIAVRCDHAVEAEIEAQPAHPPRHPPAAGRQPGIVVHNPECRFSSVLALASD